MKSNINDNNNNFIIERDYLPPVRPVSQHHYSPLHISWQHPLNIKQVNNVNHIMIT